MRQSKLRRMVKRAAVWAVLIAGEALVAALPAAILAVLLVPTAYMERGYHAIGIEWVIVGLAFCGCYVGVHRWVCDRIFDEGGEG